MADWKMPVSYNYNPSYHAYAYGLMYPQGSEQTHPTMGWAEAAYGPTAGVTSGFYSSQAPSQSPPGSPECAASNTNGHYPSSVVYYSDSQSHTQNGRLFLSHNRVHYDQQAKDQDQAGTGSDTPSDSEAHTPDSWSSGSSREGGAPPHDLDNPHWVRKEGAYELEDGSPVGSEVLSSSLLAAEEPTGLKVGGDDVPVVSAPSPPEQLSAQPRKAKPRTAFSEGQMNALTDRFNVQRYLTPAEMKTLAGLTGLTYKQVKTWFQNRRMKLKRHQKDNSWVSERYITAGIQSASSAHSQVSTRPQGNWPLPPAVTHYEFPNPSSYVPVSGNGGSAVDP
ncbi:hypothetical protein NFI96_023284, partial [Prochilodus magdalenae]